MFSNIFSGKSCCLWDNLEIYCRAGQATEDSMAYAHCMLDTKGLKTHSVYVISTVFPLLQWLHERASVLRYTFIACHVNTYFRLWV